MVNVEREHLTGIREGTVPSIARILTVWLVIGAALFAAPAMAQDDGVYRLRPGDQLDVTVLEDPSLNRQVLILPDGRISLPIAGSLDAAGRTPGELQGQVRRALSSIFVSPPTVTVSVAALGAGEDVLEDEEPPTVIYILGEVGRPGVFAFDEEQPVTILQALALAGGPGPFAARDRIQIRRVTEDGGEQLEFFDYNALEDGTGFTIPRKVLGNGDVILVPERGLFD